MKQINQALFLLLILSLVSAYDSTILGQCTGACVANCAVCNTANTSLCAKCQLGYSLSPGNTTCSLNPCLIANCDKCNVNGTVCLKCTDPYSTFNPAASSCTQVCPLSNCDKCLAGSSSCLVCNNGYSLYSINNKCITTPIPNCLTVYDFKKVEYLCTLCAAGYKPSSDQTLCIPQTCSSITDCVSCPTLPTCSQCRDGYSFTNGSCKANACSVTNCLYCDNTGSCMRCKSSFALSSGQCNPVNCSLQNCASCKRDSLYCDACLPGYSYNIWTKNCEFVTLKHQNINCQLVQTFPVTGVFACVKCLATFVFNNTNQVICIPECGANCKNCTSLTVCVECYPGYTVNNGSCIKNICSNSSNCSLCTNSTCLQCIDPYSIYDVANKICVSQCLLPNCKKCKANSKICEECQTGYANYSLNGACIPSIITNCLVLHDWRFKQYQCLKCASGYIPSSDQTLCIPNTCSSIRDCVSCPTLPTCSQCRDGYSFTNGSCKPNACSVTNCLYCGSTGYCMRYQSSSTTNCSLPNCVSCKTGSIFCDACQVGYSYNIWTKNCEMLTLKNQSINCQLVQKFPVTGLFSCVKCLPTYVFINTNQIACIKKCDMNCKSCTNQTVCGVCNPGYSVLNGSCIKNVCANTSICSLCTINNTCLQCTDPYSIYNIDSKTCMQYCSLPNCKKCKVGSKVCEQCQAGYAIYSWNGACIPSTILNCLVLHDWRSTQFQCTKCATGYKPSQDQTECILSFCSQIRDCQICIDSVTCDRCRVGYVFEDDKCVPIRCSIPNCLYCNEQGACLRAVSGFKIMGENKIEHGECSLPGCSTCKPNSMFCDTCVSGKSYNVWTKVCDLEGPSSGPNLKYLWLLSIGVVIIVAVIILIWVYQKGKNGESTNKVAPKNDLNNENIQVPDTNLGQQKNTLDQMNNQISQHYQTAPHFKSPVRLPPIKRLEQASPMTPTEDVFFESPKPSMLLKQNEM